MPRPRSAPVVESADMLQDLQRLTPFEAVKSLGAYARVARKRRHIAQIWQVLRAAEDLADLYSVGNLSQIQDLASKLPDNAKA